MKKKKDVNTHASTGFYLSDLTQLPVLFGINFQLEFLQSYFYLIDF